MIRLNKSCNIHDIHIPQVIPGSSALVDLYEGVFFSSSMSLSLSSPIISFWSSFLLLSFLPNKLKEPLLLFRPDWINLFYDEFIIYCLIFHNSWVFHSPVATWRPSDKKMFNHNDKKLKCMPPSKLNFKKLLMLISRFFGLPLIH